MKDGIPLILTKHDSICQALSGLAQSLGAEAYVEMSDRWNMCRKETDSKVKNRWSCFLG